MKPILYALIFALLLVGETFSPALAAPQAAYTCNDSYIVRRGDSLLSIANRCQISLTDLLAANPKINQSSIIYPGQVLRIVPGARPPAYPNTYTVHNGDTLSTIADKYDTTVTELLRVNPDILDPRYIYIDQVLRLPGDISGPRIALSADSVYPGYYIEATVYGFPADAYIDYRIGIAGGPYTAVNDAITGADGSASAYVVFPYSAKAGEQWEIQVLTTEMRDGVQTISDIITITQ